MVQTGAKIVGYLTDCDRIFVQGIRFVDVHRPRAPFPDGVLQTPYFGLAMVVDACFEICQRCPSPLDLGADSFQLKIAQALHPFILPK
jgi:hypothetical protein